MNQGTEAGHVFGMSWGEILIVITVGMFVLGPERIPVAVKWVGSTLKTVRTMAAGAQEQLQGEFGPELEELKRQIADLQSLKEIQELRSLRDLNPRSLITKNILGEEFSGGMSGFLGLNQTTTAPQATGSGVAAEPEQVEMTSDSTVPDLTKPDLTKPDLTKPDLTKPDLTKPDLTNPAVEAVATSEPGSTPTAPPATPGPQIPAVVINEPTVPTKNEPQSAEYSAAASGSGAPRHLAAATFDMDAT